jgi:hypothetical protein
MTMTQTRNTAVDTATEATEHTKDAGDAVAESTRSTVDQVRDGVGGAMDRMPDVVEAAKSGVETARTGVEQVAERMPAAVERSRAGAQRTTISLQALPDTTLRLLAGASIGLAAGLSLAGAPRLVAVAALVPALFVGSALATRPKTAADKSR